MDVLNDLILQAAASPWLLLVMFAVAIVDGLFPPIPSETVLVAGAAAAASTGDLTIVGPLIAVAAAGALIGDTLAYAFGRAVGTTRYRWMRHPRVAAAFASAAHGLTTRGAALIIGARYVPGGRVAVNMSAGALGYGLRRFVLVDAVGAVTWALYSAGVGVLAGHWASGQPLLSALLGAGIAVAVGLVIDRVAAVRRRRTPAAPSAASRARPGGHARIAL